MVTQVLLDDDLHLPPTNTPDIIRQQQSTQVDSGGLGGLGPDL